LSSENPKIITLVEESFQISVIKKSVYDTCLEFLKMKGFQVRSGVLVNIINEIPLEEFERILAAKDSKERYNKRLERGVKLTIRKYSSFLKKWLKEKRKIP